MPKIGLFLFVRLVNVSCWNNGERRGRTRTQNHWLWSVLRTTQKRQFWSSNRTAPTGAGCRTAAAPSTWPQTATNTWTVCWPATRTRGRWPHGKVTVWQNPSSARWSRKPDTQIRAGHSTASRTCCPGSGARKCRKRLRKTVSNGWCRSFVLRRWTRCATVCWYRARRYLYHLRWKMRSRPW